MSSMYDGAMPYTYPQRYSSSVDRLQRVSKKRTATVNFTKLKHLLIILVGIDLIQFPIDYVKSF